MKRTLCWILTLLMLFCTAIPSAAAQQAPTFVCDLPSGTAAILSSGSGTLKVTVSDASAFAGVQFIVATGGGAVIDSVTYSVSGMALPVATLSDGRRMFGVLSAENAYQSVVASIHVVSAAGGTLTFDQMKVMRVVDGQTDILEEILTDGQPIALTEATSGGGTGTGGSGTGGSGTGTGGTGTGGSGTGTGGSGTGGSGTGTGSSGSGGTAVIDPGTIPAAVNPFTDLGTVAWAQDAILGLYARGVVAGDGTGLYDPNRSVTREEFMKMLMLAFKLASADTSETFSDVVVGQWYEPFVRQGAGLDIILGYPDGRFGVKEPIRRQDLAVILNRTAAALPFTMPAGTPVAFTDAASISNYAQDAVSAMAANGIFNGRAEGLFVPAGTCTRAEAAVVIHRLLTLTGR